MGRRIEASVVGRHHRPTAKWTVTNIPHRCGRLSTREGRTASKSKSSTRAASTALHPAPRRSPLGTGGLLVLLRASSAASRSSGIRPR
ncbi:hypothetical protein K466DRAFT_592901 [Polyporus arcularius HHB13444]|uniref:Uncharacterized protein n=1 Tax=Polyporus arcularius HHB13444 TaxID=1314778 RepID=A0A5C3NQ83_9APHY|nr:hypothetical protein K466DRAFT_592901 [Polyporus arcularius HHB13444]